MITLVTASGEEHGLINRLSNSVEDHGYKHMKPERKKHLEADRKRDKEKVRAEYMNSRGPHERLTKPYCRYAGDPIEVWHFIPGKIYEVPFGLVKEVNDKNKILKRRAGLVSEDGKDLKMGGSPIESDTDGEWLHKFIPCGFKSEFEAE